MMCCNHLVFLVIEDNPFQRKIYIFCECKIGKYNILCFSLTFLLENVTLYVTF